MGMSKFDQKHTKSLNLKDGGKWVKFKITPEGADWEWFEDWSPAVGELPQELEDCGWRCNNCKTSLEDSVGGYWDDYESKPKLKYCPECGVKIGTSNEHWCTHEIENRDPCKGCKHIGFRYPYASMYPCNNCVRANSKDYYNVDLKEV